MITTLRQETCFGNEKDLRRGHTCMVYVVIDLMRSKIQQDDLHVIIHILHVFAMKKKKDPFATCVGTGAWCEEQNPAIYCDMLSGEKSPAMRCFR